MTTAERTIAMECTTIIVEHCLPWMRRFVWVIQCDLFTGMSVCMAFPERSAPFVFIYHKPKPRKQAIPHLTLMSTACGNIGIGNLDRVFETNIGHKSPRSKFDGCNRLPTIIPLKPFSLVFRRVKGRRFGVDMAVKARAPRLNDVLELRLLAVRVVQFILQSVPSDDSNHAIPFSIICFCDEAYFLRS